MTAAKPDPASLTVNEAATLRAFFQDNGDPTAEIDAHDLVNTVVAGIDQSIHSARGYLGSLVRKGYLVRRDYSEENRSTYALTANGFAWAQSRGVVPVDEVEEPVNVQRPPAPGPAVLDDDIVRDPVGEGAAAYTAAKARSQERTPNDFDLELQEIIVDQERANERLFDYARHLSAAGRDVPQALVRAILSSRDTLKALSEIR